MSARMQVRRENVRVFIDRAVLDNGPGAFAYLANLVKTTIKKIDLQVKSPLGHVAIKIAQVWVVVNRLEQCSPPIMLRKFLGEGTFPGAYIAGDSDVFDFFQGRN